MGGAGSVQGIVSLPRRAYHHSKNAWYLRLPEPKVAIVYFYEGNDLDNNLNFLTKNLPPLDQLKQLDRADAARQIDQAITVYAARKLPKDSAPYFPFFAFMMRLAEANLQTPASARASAKANSDERGAAKVKRDRWRIGL